MKRIAFMQMNIHTFIKWLILRSNKFPFNLKHTKLETPALSYLWKPYFESIKSHSTRPRMRLESWSQLLVVVVVVMVGAYATIFYPIHMLNYAKKRLIPATFFLFSVGTHQQGTSIHVSNHLPFSKRKTKLENMSMSSHCSSSTMNLSMMKIWKYSE